MSREKNTTIKFVNNVLNKNFVDAKENFKEMFYAKSMEKLEDRKVQVSKNIYSSSLNQTEENISV
jgi:hypothetical protein